MDPLEAISPVDGRYRRHTEPLADIFSEKALIGNRIKVEGEYLILLSEHLLIPLWGFSEDEKSIVRNLYNPSLEDAKLVKSIETKDHGIESINKGKKTNHDVKAVEYYMRHKLNGTSLEDCLGCIHFCLTSEDTTNIAYGLMLRDGVERVLLPSLQQIYQKLEGFAKEYKDDPMLARTHGQAASPTTVGKEFKVFSSRLEKQIKQLEGFELSVKLNGATGNYNAHYATSPEIDWIKFSKEFIEKFNTGHGINLKPNLITTQIEPHDTYAELFDIISRGNTILIGFNQDMWRYISDDWIKQKPVEGEVGSSTMPHKVNPIDFENSEGNLGIANALFSFFSSKLPISRFQRDLSDSTVERNFGVAFAHSQVGYKSILSGLDKIAINEQRIAESLEEHPEIISEAIQVILRREGVEMPYELLRDLTRGRKVTLAGLYHFIDRLNISDETKEELCKITPQNYTGIAKLLCEL